MAKKTRKNKRQNRRVKPDFHFNAKVEDIVEKKDDGTLVLTLHTAGQMVEGSGYAKDQINPSHYKRVLRRSSTFNPGYDLSPEDVAPYMRKLESLPIQVVDIIETFAAQDAHLAHAFTYLLRAGDKLEPGETKKDAIIRDLNKSLWWIARRIEFLGGPKNPFVK